jgi:hypothetical protein
MPLLHRRRAPCCHGDALAWGAFFTDLSGQCSHPEDGLGWGATGVMFGFRRKRFAGSQRASSRHKRSRFVPKEARTFSSASPVARWLM